MTQRLFTSGLTTYPPRRESMVVSLLTLCPPAAVYVWADNIPSPKGEHGALRTPHFLLRVTPSHSVVPSGHVTIPAWSQGIAKWQPHRSSVGPPPKKWSVIFWLCRDSWSFAVAVWHRGDSNVQRFHPDMGESFGKSRGASYCDMQRHATQC